MAANNDWFVANMKLPSATYDDFKTNNITPENTNIKDKDYYKQSPAVQEMFKDEETGKFDDKKYDNYYNALLYSYNEFANNDFITKASENFEYHPYNAYIEKDDKIISDLYKVEKISNPFKQRVGIEGFNIRSKSEYSIRELAQMNKVRDFSTGETLDWTPNDDAVSGLFDFWKKPTVVLGQYDTDGEHYDAQLGRKVKHVAGDYKTDEDGNFFYETLGDREAYNKDVLNWTDTLTTDGTFGNKYDFMDSDGIDKSITGILTKTAVKAIPLFIPGVGQIYAAGIVGVELMNVIPMLYKSGASLFIGDADTEKDYWKKLNKIQGLSAALSTSTSDYSRSKMFTAEGMGQLVGDIFSQLYTQRMIASIPGMIGMTAKSTQGYAKAKAIFGESVANKMVSGTLTLAEKNRIIESVPEAASFINRTIKSINMSKGLATSYMAATSAVGVVEESKKLGLDERDTGAMYLGTALGFFGMMRALPIGEWAMKGIGIDEGAALVKKGLKTEIEKIAPAIKKISESGAPAGVKYQKLFDKGKSIGQSIAAKLKNVEDYKGAMLSEGAEETSEELMQDSIKGIYNGLASLGFVSSDHGDKFSYGEAKDILGRYGMAAIGGAIGGGLFKLNDSLMNTINNVDKESKHDLAYLIRNGYKDQIMKQIDEMEKNGQFGSKVLSTELSDINLPGLENKTVFKPADTTLKSQNSVVAGMMRNLVNNIDNQIFQEGIPTDIDLSRMLDARTDLIVNLKANSPLYEDFNNLVNDIIDIKEKIRKASEVKESDPLSEIEASKKAINKLNVELGRKQEELRLITSGEKFVDYQKQALFYISQPINESFAKLSLDDFSLQNYGSHYKDLSKELQKESFDKHTAWKALEGKDKLKEAYKRFTYVNEKFSTKLQQIAAYASQRAGHYTIVDLEQNVQLMRMLSKDTLGKINEYKNSLNRNLFLDERLSPKTDSFQDKEVAVAEILALLSNPNFDKFDESIVNDMRSFIHSTYLMNYSPYSASETYQENNQFDAEHQEAISKLPFFGLENPLDGAQISNLETLRQKYLEEYKDKPAYVDVINGYFNELLLDQEILLGNEKINSFEQLAKGRTINTLNELIKQFEIIQNGQVSNIVSLITEEFETIEKLERITEYEINNPNVIENLEYARDLLNQLHSVFISATNYVSKGGSAVGYNNTINKTFPDLKLGTISQDQMLALGQELSILETKIDFLLDLSKLNTGDKVKNETESGLNMEALFYEQLLEGKPLGDYLRSIGIDDEKFIDDSIVDAINNADLLKKIITSKRSDKKEALPSSDEDLLAFEIQKTSIQQAIYNRVNILAEKYKDQGGKKYLFNRIFQIDENGVMSDKARKVFSPISLSHPKPTDFSTTETSIQPLDLFIWLNTTIIVNPSEFISELRGQKLESGKYSGIESSIHAPFYGQEYSAKIVFGLLTNPEWINNALSKLNNGNGAYLQKIIEPLFNSVFIDGVPGSGKSSAIASNLARMLKERGIEFWSAGPYKEQADQLDKILNSTSSRNLDKINLLKEIVGSTNGIVDQIQEDLKLNPKDADFSKKSKYIERVTDNFIFEKDGVTPDSIKGLQDGQDYKKHEFWKLKSDIDSKVFTPGKLPKVIFIDEITHFTNIEIGLMQKAFSTMKNPPLLILMGDTRQNGALFNKERHNINGFHTWRTPKLGSSLRNSNNHKRKNLINIVALYNKVEELYHDIEVVKGKNYSDILPEVKKYLSEGDSANKFKMHGHTDEQGKIFGEKIIDPKTLNIDYVRKMASLSDTPIGLITDNLDSDLVAMITNDPTLSNKVIVKTPSKVQGLEFDNVIIDVNWEQFYKGDIMFGLLNLVSNIYTLTSRSKSGTVITDRGLSTNGMFTITPVIENSVYPTELDKNLISDYKDKRLKILKSLSEQFPFNEEQKSVTNKPIVNKGTGSGSVEINLLREVFSELEKSRKVRETGVINDYNANSYNDTRLLAYPYYERWNVVKDRNGKYTAADPNEDLGYFISLHSHEGKTVRVDVSNDKLENYNSIIRNIKTSILYNRDFSGVERLLDTDSELDLENMKLVVRVSAYDPEYDKSHDSSFDATKQITKNAPFMRLALEIPRFDGTDKEPVYITIAPLGAIDTVRRETPSNVKLNEKLTELNNIAITKLKTEKSFNWESRGKDADLLEVVSNVKLKRIPKRISYDEMKKLPESGMVSLPYIITGHPPILGIAGEAEFEKWVKEKKLVGRAVCFVTYDPNLTDPNKLRDVYVQERSEHYFKQDNLDPETYIPKVKMIVLNEAGYKASEWISKVMNSVRSKKSATNPLGLQSSPEMAARVYNSILRVYEFHKDQNTTQSKALAKTTKIIIDRVNEILAVSEKNLEGALQIDPGKEAKYQVARIEEIAKKITKGITDENADRFKMEMSYDNVTSPLMINFKYNHTYRLLVALGIAIEGGSQYNMDAKKVLHYDKLWDMAPDVVQTQFWDSFDKEMAVEYPDGLYTHAIYEQTLSGKHDMGTVDFAELAAGEFMVDVVPTTPNVIIDLNNLITAEDKDTLLKDNIVIKVSNLLKIVSIYITNPDSIAILNEMIENKFSDLSIKTIDDINKIENDIRKEIIRLKDLQIVIDENTIQEALKIKGLESKVIKMISTPKGFDFTAENDTFVITGTYNINAKSIQNMQKIKKEVPPDETESVKLQANIISGLDKEISKLEKLAVKNPVIGNTVTSLQDFKELVSKSRDELLTMATNPVFISGVSIVTSLKDKTIYDDLVKYLTETEYTTCNSI